MKIISYNVNGIRAAIKKGLVELIQRANPDIVCIQETKAHIEDINAKLFEIVGYRLCGIAPKRKDIAAWEFFFQEKSR